MSNVDGPHLLHQALQIDHNDRRPNLIVLGSLQAFSSVFSDRHVSLPILGELRSHTRSDPTPSSKLSLQVNLCVGLVNKDALHRFFESMFDEFQSGGEFSSFLNKGRAIAITGGAHEEIVAAVVFIGIKRGMFIDALAVANGHAPGGCNLNTANFSACKNDEKELMKDSAGSFQRLGLGTFLLSLAALSATVTCTDHCTIHLKSNLQSLDFYKAHGCAPLPLDQSLPRALAQSVPSHKLESSPMANTLLLSMNAHAAVQRIRGHGRNPSGAPAAAVDGVSDSTGVSDAVILPPAPRKKGAAKSAKADEIRERKTRPPGKKKLRLAGKKKKLRPAVVCCLHPTVFPLAAVCRLSPTNPLMKLNLTLKRTTKELQTNGAKMRLNT